MLLQKSCFQLLLFKTLDILQGSVATHLSCGGNGIFIVILLYIFSWFWQWNNFENRLILGKVKAYINGANFWATLYMRAHCNHFYYGDLSSEFAFVELQLSRNIFFEQLISEASN